ncbi:TetR/AcrR family transcriptional regulator [Mucilaginibacter sp. CAU 1740]|uniref:TetR/AcrR family transcriptional regulator n=1 Tax=Mucilaginibacter sp. CAU 1740 TaxID=3140365 RepID=UPI00325BF2EB
MTKQRGQAVTDKIIDTAGRLFYKQGFNATGINQVIEEADIAKASLYKHFESKNDLMVAYLQGLHQSWYNRLETDIEKISDPKEKLLALFDHHDARQQFRDFGGCPFIKANNEAGAADPRILTEVQEAKEHAKSYIKTLVANSGHRQVLSDDELAETIFLMIEGGVTTASVFKQSADLQTAKKLIQKLI